MEEKRPKLPKCSHDMSTASLNLPSFSSNYIYEKEKKIPLSVQLGSLEIEPSQRKKKLTMSRLVIYTHSF